jgi:exopolyphosphatase/guanosine-5'-triphosphate,3'-diphosphate pyrophosphatase
MSTVAAVDCGTNSTRLLIDDEGRTVERLMHITRLGQGVDATGRLAPEAIERTMAVLVEYRQAMDRHGVERVRMTATSAARDADNREDFFAGATADLDPADGPFLVVDIGGGSTEFAVGTEECEGAMSIDIGCVRLTEKFLLHDPPQADELSACLSVVQTYLDDVARDLPAVLAAKTFVGLAGTVSTVAAVELGLADYDRDAIHHLELSHEAVEDVFRTLATETRVQRLANPGMEEARADVIVGGCCILVKLMRQFGLATCLVSEADILDGLVASIR